MIPKVIHYCWFGKGEKPALVKKCIASWKHYLSDYQIIEWNEENFDINENIYCKEAYECKKYAFVSDYVRLKVLYENGGIYMDTDVEVVKKLDSSILENKAFSGFESITNIPTGIMGCEKNFELFCELLDYYKGINFIKEDGSYNVITNVEIITDILLKYGLKRNNAFQVVRDFTLYPKDYFCPLEDETGKMIKTGNTYVIHWFSKTWWDEESIRKYKIVRAFYKLFGKERVNYIKNAIGKKNIKWIKKIISRF